MSMAPHDIEAIGARTPSRSRRRSLRGTRTAGCCPSTAAPSSAPAPPCHCTATRSNPPHARPHRRPLRQPPGRCPRCGWPTPPASTRGARNSRAGTTWRTTRPACRPARRGACATSVAADVRLADVDASPDPHWAALFLGQGVAPGRWRASRALAVARHRLALCQRARERRHPVAAGAMAFGHGWAQRARHAHRAVAARARPGPARARRVGAGGAGARRRAARSCRSTAQNQPALALYRRAGFETRWQYCYWQRQQWPALS